MFRRFIDWLSGTDRQEYECQQCGSGFADRRQACPDCGGCHIDRVDWEDVTSRH